MAASSTGDSTSDPESSPTPRRRFLQWLRELGAAISAFLVGYPSFRALLWPIRATPGTDHWIKVVDDVALLDIGAPVRIDFVPFRRH